LAAATCFFSQTGGNAGGYYHIANPANVAGDYYHIANPANDAGGYCHIESLLHKENV
jgi:hypothetical protein